MTINIFVLKGDLNGKNRSGAFLFLSGIYLTPGMTSKFELALNKDLDQPGHPPSLIRVVDERSVGILEAKFSPNRTARNLI